MNRSRKNFSNTIAHFCIQTEFRDLRVIVYKFRHSVRIRKSTELKNHRNRTVFTKWNKSRFCCSARFDVYPLQLRLGFPNQSNNDIKVMLTFTFFFSQCSLLIPLKTSWGSNKNVGKKRFKKKILWLGKT